MQTLYVADFVVEPTHDDVSTRDVGERCLDLLGRWLSGRQDAPVSAVDLLEDGRRELAPSHGDERQYAVWEHISAAEDWVTRIERRHVRLDGSQFVTVISVGVVAGVGRVYVSMGREAGSTALSPVKAADIRQPWFLSMLAEEPSLRLLADGQVQDGRYIQARSREVVSLVASVLTQSRRLPILLLHTRTEEAHMASREAALGLLGMVQVVTLDLRSARLLHDLEPRADIEYASGLLVWADIAAPPTPVAPEIVNSEDRYTLRNVVMAQVAPLSVLMRPSDPVARAVRRAARRLAAAEAEQRTAAAAASGSQDELVVALTDERDRAVRDAEDAAEMWEEAEARAHENADEVARLRAQVQQLQLAAQYSAQSGGTVLDVPTFDNVPPLVVGDAESLDAVCKHLEQASEGRIAFTTRAIAAWKKADRYATPEEMHTSLVRLARVAHDLYDGQERKMGHVDTWMRENYDLKVSLQDDQMPKAFRYVEHEGERYDRTPHVKVNDGVPHHECGRVYFTLDKDQQRVLVSHVGLKY